MAFDPESFLAAAKAFLGSASTEADFRTIAGRAYYAAYGSLRVRLCRAKGLDPTKLFDKSGRHVDLVRGISTSSHGIKRVQIQYQRLLAKRVRADYRYGERVTQGDAEMAISDADWVVSHLASLRDREFRSFPLAPRQQ